MTDTKYDRYDCLPDIYLSCSLCSVNIWFFFFFFDNPNSGVDLLRKALDKLEFIVPVLEKMPLQHEKKKKPIY